MCTAAIRPFPDKGVEIRCGRGDHADAGHSGTLRDYAYPGSKTDLSWLDDDRRNYHGEYPGMCDTSGCELPKGHPRGHQS